MEEACEGFHPESAKETVRILYKMIEQNNLLEAPAVLIGTPGRIAYHLRNENFDPAIAKALVLDEFDKALELGFQEDMSFIIKTC